jgi:hypothetical protein
VFESNDLTIRRPGGAPVKPLGNGQLGQLTGGSGFRDPVATNLCAPSLTSETLRDGHPARRKIQISAYRATRVVIARALPLATGTNQS